MSKIHVVPNPNGGWSVKKGGASKASRTFDSKSSATAYGREVSQSKGSDLIVHREDGTIQSSDCYGNPCPQKG